MRQLSMTWFFESDPQIVFDALTNINRLKKWASPDAEFEKEKDGRFSLWNDEVHGINCKVERTQIHQKWKKEDWRQYSDVKININGAERGTQVEVIHDNIPDQEYDAVINLWESRYLKPLEKHLQTDLGQAGLTRGTVGG